MFSKLLVRLVGVSIPGFVVSSYCIGERKHQSEASKCWFLGWLCPISKCESNKIFNDCIHGSIEMNPLCVSIIDTPQFQRLRQIKQMGGAYFVYPGAAHNRFEHSIGVSHLAGKLAKNLKMKHRDLGITDQDVLCVEIAGLCHDLGHGPFSHLFDSMFIPLVCPHEEPKWKHEDASVKMFEHLVEENNLMEKFTKQGLNKTDIAFIKQLIKGEVPDDRKSPKENEFTGRTNAKAFLYEIVANKRTGIDVDKLDYFARDCYMLGIPNSFDYRRYLKFARVLKVDGELHIGTRDKEVDNLYSLFKTRYNIHRRACKHTVTKSIEMMISEALQKANEHFFIKGEKGMLKMSEAIHDMTAYTKMTDNILYEILNTECDELQESRDIITSMLKRKIYKCVASAIPNEKICPKPKEIVKEIVDLEKEKLKPTDLDAQEVVKKNVDLSKAKLKTTDLDIQIIDFNYGMGSDNPVESVFFYTKKDPDNGITISKSQVSQMLPRKFSEKEIRLYCKNCDEESVKIAKDCFEEWCEKNNCTLKGSDNKEPECIPACKKHCK